MPNVHTTVEIFREVRLEGSRERRVRRVGAEKAWVAGCPLKVPKGQFPVKYTRTLPRLGAWAVSGREIDIKADGVYEGKYRNIFLRSSISYRKIGTTFHRRFMPNKISIGLDK